MKKDDDPEIVARHHEHLAELRKRKFLRIPFDENLRGREKDFDRVGEVLEITKQKHKIHNARFKTTKVIEIEIVRVRLKNGQEVRVPLKECKS
jgi:predicted RNA methylase